MKPIYLFSGLGADERVFQFLDFSGYEPVFVQWIPPRRRETIRSYAERLLEQIPTERPLLIGLSFGGLMAVEVAKLVETEKIILLASAKTRREIPFYFRLSGLLNLHRLLPTRVMLRPNLIVNWLFGVETGRDKKMLADILRDTDPAFFKWAMDELVTWKNTVEFEHIIHIHGKADRIFPFWNVSSDLAVPGGGHFMTLNKAEELTRKIRKALVKEPAAFDMPGSQHKNETHKKK